MPLYEYLCGDCGTAFEAIQSFSATATPICPNCQSSNVSRMLSRPAIHFKGSGWYITDSKNTGKQSANGAGKESGRNGENGSSENGAAEKGESSKESAPKEAAPSAESKSSVGESGTKSAAPASAN